MHGEAAAGRPDAEVVGLVLAGRQEEYSVLIGRYQEALFRHALGMVGDSDAAADLVQDSFVKGYTSLDRCQDPSRFGAWIFRILRNRCLDYLKDRRRGHVSVEEGAAHVASGDDPGLELDRAETRRTVGRALASLPDSMREAFLLKHVDGYSYEEMAEMLGASVSALKMRVMRAREALQAALGVRESAEL